jgi:hypothetical protein
VAHSAVQRAIKERRISTLPDGKIDPDVADEEWARTTRQYAPAVTRRRQADVDDGDPAADQYTKARSVRAHFEARISKLTFERLAGSMVSTEDLRMAQFQIDRRHRDAMLNIPDRTCAAVAAEVREMLISAGVPAEQAAVMHANRVHAIMSTQIRQALTEYADGLTDPSS